MSEGVILKITIWIYCILQYVVVSFRHIKILIWTPTVCKGYKEVWLYTSQLFYENDKYLIYVENSIFNQSNFPGSNNIICQSNENSQSVNNLIFLVNFVLNLDNFTTNFLNISIKQTIVLFSNFILTALSDININFSLLQDKVIPHQYFGWMK